MQKFLILINLIEFERIFFINIFFLKNDNDIDKSFRPI